MSDRMPAALKAFVALVVAVGAALIIDSVIVARQAPLNVYAALLAIATLASGRFAIKIPGRNGTVSVSEVFVFTAVLVYGPSVATVIVAIDGLSTSLFQRHRSLHRALFNTAEPAISVWAAGQTFRAVHHPMAAISSESTAVVAAAIAMGAVFFVLNSGLTAIAIGVESRESAYGIWRRHAPYLATNYYAAASLAALAVTYGGTVNVAFLALIVPLLLVSYSAYHEASTRIGETERHLSETGRLYHAATEMLAIAVDAKDQVTHGHIRRVQRHTLAVAASLGVTDPRELKAIEAGALLHDIGKLGVPDYVLNKPSALTRAEFETIKTHASMGARILMAVDFPYPVVPIVRHHHEQWNGRGYPDGLVGAEIPLGARIIAVVDCFDALTSDRPYRPRLDDAAAIELLRSRSGSFYDPTIVDKFIELLPILQHNDAGEQDRSDRRASVVAGLTRAALDPTAQRAVDECALTVGDAARRLIERYAAASGAGDVCLFGLTRSGDVIVSAYATAGLRSFVDAVQIPIGGGVSGWVAAHRNTIRRADASLDLGTVADRLGLWACTSTPVFVAGDMAGALTVYRGSEPTPEDVAAIGVLAQDVGLALARADERAPAAPSRVRLQHPTSPAGTAA